MAKSVKITPAKKLISVVCVAYNEEACITELSRRIRDVISGEKMYSWQVVLIDNGSIDKTWNLICDESKKDPVFHGLKLSRNFQMDGGLLAGLEAAQGDACILMAADLQDPPEIIPLFLRAWEAGADNVYAEVTSRKHSTALRRMNSALFYFLASRASSGVIKKNVSDFRLVDKKVYTTIREMRERNRFLRGLFSWAGFKTAAVRIDRPARFGGRSNATTLKVLTLAIRGILAHSYLPIRAISLFGLAMSVSAILFIVALAVYWIAIGVPFQGFGSLATLNLVSLAILSAMLSVIGEYIALIYEETKGRPNYIVAERTRKRRD